MARYTHFKAAASVGKCPRALTALRIRALTLSEVICSPSACRVCGLRFCVVDGVHEAAVVVLVWPFSGADLLSNRDGGLTV